MVKLAINPLSQLREYARRAKADCGPTCLAMVAQALGKRLTPDDFTQALGSIDPGGADITSLARVAGTVGITLRWEGGLTSALVRIALGRGQLVVALVPYWLLPHRYDRDYRLGHYIVFAGATDRLLFYHDPYWPDETQGAWLNISDEQLDTLWSQSRASTGFNPRQGLVLQGAAVPRLGTPPAPSDGLRAMLLNDAAHHRTLTLNPQAALFKKMTADSFSPVGPEFEVSHQGRNFVAQGAIRAGDGVERVYYAPMGDWGNAQWVG